MSCIKVNGEKMNKEKEKSINVSMRIFERQATEISKLLKNKNKEEGYLGYDNANDFVKTAVDNEIKTATLLKELTPAGRIIFEDLLRHKRYEAYREAKIITGQNNIIYDSNEEFKASESLRKSYSIDSALKYKQKKKK